MSYISLYRKWRPRRFDEVAGQEHIVRALSNAVKRDQIAHAYLFCGPRGTGKTTVARILAKSVNCIDGPTVKPDDTCRLCVSINRGNSLDVFEIDGASNRGIDDARELRENTKFAPSEGRKKFYIIDEAHMLTTEAFNALLKTLEEPPDHLVFIMATTEPHKVPATIASRCQVYEFHRIKIVDVVERLRKVAEAEEIAIADDAVQLIARQARGSLRDALSMLEQVSFVSDEAISPEMAASILGTQSTARLASISEYILSGDPGKIFRFTAEAVEQGCDFAMLLKELIGYFRQLMVAAHTEEDIGYLEVTDEESELIKKQAKAFNMEHIYACVEIASDVLVKIKQGADERVWFEMALIRMINAGPEKKRQVETMGCDEAIDEPTKVKESAVETNVVSAAGPDVEVDEGNTIEQHEVQHSVNDTANVIKMWPKIIEKVKKERISTYALLLECHPQPGTDGLELHFHKDAEFHRQELEKPQHLEILQAAIAKETGKNMRVACLNNQTAMPAKKTQIEPSADPVSGDDMVKLAKESFQAIVVEEEQSGAPHPQA